MTEHYYLRARYYNPLIGRFVQEDEYQDNGLNLYMYCNNNPVMYYDPSGYVSSYYFRADDDYKKGNNIGLPLGSDADITSFYTHVNNKETTSGSSIYTSFSTELQKTFKFTKDKKVVKVKVSDLKVLESEGLIKIYQPKDVKALLTKQGLKRDANNVFETMMKNNEVLIEGEIPDDIIKQVWIVYNKLDRYFKVM